MYWNICDKNSVVKCYNFLMNIYSYGASHLFSKGQTGIFILAYILQTLQKMFIFCCSKISICYFQITSICTLKCDVFISKL